HTRQTFNAVTINNTDRQYIDRGKAPHFFISDQNDHSPFFQNDFVVIGIEENVPVGTLVYTFHARDEDGSFLNSKLQYSMHMKDFTENPFLIHPSYGSLITAVPLDREITQSIVLTVFAVDQAVNLTDRRQSSLTAKIVILDVNDNTPHFVSSPVSYIREDAEVGSFVHHIIAQDPDQGRNGQVTYHLLSNSKGLLVTIFALNRECQEYYNLTVVALDDGTPALSATQSLTVIVLDVNDEAPVFTKNHYHTSVSEDIDEGSTVLELLAMDADEGPNGKVTYSLVDGTFGMFAIDRVTGAIITTKPLDREIKSQYILKNPIIRLFIEASDNGNTPLTAVTLVVIQIQDVNNYTPQFTVPTYELSINENASLGEKLFTFSAIDYDRTHQNAYVEYSIIGGNGSNTFSVENCVLGPESPDKVVGNLVLRNSLDRERSSFHQLLILASDHGTPPLNATATVLITVLDANDNPPVFTSLEYHVHVKEDFPVGSPIISVSASDYDSGSNAAITYNIMSGNDNGHFRLEEKTGSLHLVRALDYEETMEFTLTVRASDGGVGVKNVAFAIVFISILDVNDYAPIFVFPSLDCGVTENLPPFSSVCTISALDFDTGPNGHLSYSIQSSCLPDHGHHGDPDMFFMDPLKGEICTKHTLDFEHQNKYCFIVQAKDKSDLTATIIVQVNVRGADEFDPVFSQDQYFFDFPEKNEAGQLVGKVTASDYDGGLDGAILYTLIKPSAFFSVNHSSGSVYLTRSFHRKRHSIKKTGKTLELLIKAHSPKLNSRSSTCTVLVNISNTPESFSMLPAQTVSVSIAVSTVTFLLLEQTMPLLFSA
uniref:Cadherin domain-containing protein n=1 Tax=Anolis carolinensis TaxID=28377 RepID=A0A803T7K3_ANOCA